MNEKQASKSVLDLDEIITNISVVIDAKYVCANMAIMK